MKIIIAGAGEVGFHLAKLLSYESQDITLLDTDKESLSYADTHLDIRTIKGDATSIAILQDARVEGVDLVIAVTSSETTNITVCVLAKQLGATRTIARISNTEFIEHKELAGFSKFGIDELISPESLAASEIGLLLNQSGFSDSYEFEEGALTMVGTTLSKTAPFIGKSVKEAANIFPGLHFMPIAIQRIGTQYTLIPRGDTVFKEGDQAYFMTIAGGVEEIYKLTGKARQEIKNVMMDLADILPKALVLKGDGRNVKLLEEENIQDMDAFISVTGDSETNIMSCLVAKSKGVKKTIALVENMDYFQLSQSIGIDTLINKKLLAANNIFRYIRKGEVVAMTKLNNMNAELLEFMVRPSSEAEGKSIKDLDFPRSATIAGVVREGKGIIALGDFKIIKGDRVVVCCLPRSIKKVEKMFV